MPFGSEGVRSSGNQRLRRWVAFGVGLSNKGCYASIIAVAVIICIAILGFVNFLNSFSLFGEPSYKTISSFPSPDGKRTADIVEVNGGATVAYSYFVRIQPGNQEAAMIYKPYEGASSVKVRWLDRKTLDVTFGHARIARMERIDGLSVILCGTEDRS